MDLDASDAPLLRVTAIGSTNDELVRLAQSGAADGTALVADEQTAGRGRRGKSWQTLPGRHVLLSVLHRSALPAGRLAGVTLDVGNAVAELLEGFGLVPRLKWPNDVQLAGKKVGGILCEMVDGPGVVIGLGLNVEGTELPPDLAHATTLALNLAHVPSVDALVPQLVDAIRKACRAYDRRGGPDIDSWLRRAVGIGGRVKQLPDGRGGRVDGVAPDGALLVRWDGMAAAERFVAGDLELIAPD